VVNDIAMHEPAIAGQIKTIRKEVNTLNLNRPMDREESRNA